MTKPSSLVSPGSVLEYRISSISSPGPVPTSISPGRRLTAGEMLELGLESVHRSSILLMERIGASLPERDCEWRSNSKF